MSVGVGLDDGDDAGRLCTLSSARLIGGLRGEVLPDGREVVPQRVQVNTRDGVANHPSGLTALGEVRESCLLPKERETYDAGRTVALLGDDQFRGSGIGVVRVAVI